MAHVANRVWLEHLKVCGTDFRAAYRNALMKRVVYERNTS